MLYFSAEDPSSTNSYDFSLGYLEEQQYGFQKKMRKDEESSQNLSSILMKMLKLESLYGFPPRKLFSCLN